VVESGQTRLMHRVATAEVSGETSTTRIGCNTSSPPPPRIAPRC